MLETTLGGGLFAVAVVLAWLAMKRPEIYHRVSGVLGAAALAALIGLFVWSEASSRTFQAVAPFLTNEDLASEVVDGLRAPAVLYGMITSGLAFLLLLRGLTRFLDKSGTDRSTGPE